MGSLLIFPRDYALTNQPNEGVLIAETEKPASEDYSAVGKGAISLEMGLSSRFVPLVIFLALGLAGGVQIRNLGMPTR